MSLVHQALSKSKKPAWPAAAAKPTPGSVVTPQIAAWIPFVLGVIGVLAVGAAAALFAAGPVEPSPAPAPAAPAAPAPTVSLTPGDPNDLASVEVYENPFEGLVPGEQGAGIEGLRPATVISTSAPPAPRAEAAEQIPLRDGGRGAASAVSSRFTRIEIPEESSFATETAGDPPPSPPAAAPRPSASAPTTAPRVRPLEMGEQAPVTVTPSAASLASVNGRVETAGGAVAAPGATLGIGSKIRSRGGAAQLDFTHAEVTLSGDGTLEIKRNETREGPDGIARNATVKLEGGRADVNLRPTTPRDAFLLSAGRYSLSAPSGSFSVESAPDGAPRVTVRQGIVVAHPHDGGAPVRIDAGQVRELR